MRIPLSAPDVTETEIEAVAAVLRTPWLSLGPRLAAFEGALASWVGTTHGVGVSSGTAGLHLCVKACGLGPGDEVITSPFSFVASANAILYEGALPVFVDVDPVSLNIDPQRIEAAITPRTRAILVVHVFGRPAAMAEILAIARRHGLIVIEDACEALGATSGGRAVGSLGDCGVFAFYPNKQITTGEGGIVVTGDARLAERCRSLRNHGRDGSGVAHARLGYNYRLSEMAAALGLGQLARLPEILERRRAVAQAYHDRLAGCADLVLPEMELADARISWFVFVVRLADRFRAADRDRLLAALQQRGIGCQRYFPPLHQQPHLQALAGQRSFPVTEAVAERTLALPFFNRLRSEDVDEVCGTLRELLGGEAGRA
jgi:perosamine synthetase